MTLKTVGSGDVISTPTLKKFLIEDMMDELDQEDRSRYTDGFKDRMTYQCGVCKGSGIHPTEKCPCPACEGTGVDYAIEYGIEDGKLYARTIQYGIDFFKEMCKAMREAEAEATLSQRASMMGRTMFRLPAVIDMELQAQGFTPQDIRGNGPRHKEVIKVVQRDYPDFMCSSLRF